MRTRTVRKLVLNRETLRSLGDGQLSRIRAGEGSPAPTWDECFSEICKYVSIFVCPETDLCQ